MEERKLRKGNYAVDGSFEELLDRMNNALSPVEQKMLLDSSEANELPPLLFLCYAPRTGSTMIAQYLARTECFSYVSNFTARFWEAPYLAMLFEKKMELLERFKCKNGDVNNSYGVTSNISDPHEFGFFWNKFLTSKENHFINVNDLSSEKIEYLQKTVNALRSVTGKTFFFKNAIAGYNTAFVRKVFPEARFLVIKRDPIFVAQSIYIARQDLYQNTKEWWSLRPRDFQGIHSRSENEYEEIAWQIKSINDDIAAGLTGAEKNVLTVTYEDFCKRPSKEMNRIMDWMQVDSEINIENILPQFIKESCYRKVSSIVYKQITKHVERVIG